MAVVRLDRLHHVVPPQIPRPDLLGMAAPAVCTGDLVGVDFRPQTRLYIAKCRHSALGGNPGTAEHGHLHATKLAGFCDTGHVTDLGEWVHVDPRAARPLFDQLRTQIIEGIRGGRLSPGTRLPTVRELAVQMNMAVNTVARAYRELEAAGMLETRGRFGTFVARADPADSAMADAARAYADTARALGVGKAAALRYVDAAFG